MERSELFTRLTTGLVLVLLTIVALILGKIYLFLGLEVLIFLGSLEFFRMVGLRGFLPNFVGIGAALLIGFGFYIDNPLPLLVIPLLTVLGLQLTLHTDYRISSTAMTVMGTVYPALFLAHILPLRRIGLDYALIPLLYTWVFDTSAYLIGSRFGRRKITARISPGKSLEGTLGGFLVAVSAGLVASITFAQFLSIPHAFILGAIVVFTAQVGDLFESLLKRSVQLKDSSSLLPGHGGVLDRLDSLIFTIPVAYYYLSWFTK